MASLVHIVVICVLLCTAFSGLDGDTGQPCLRKGKHYLHEDTTRVVNTSRCETLRCNDSHWEIQKTVLGRAVQRQAYSTTTAPSRIRLQLYQDPAYGFDR
ncbi:hypothetical protein PoB_003205900 [Plakobranchus ocellatus]|uniref:Secreted protein n=1 Tax=Plakobranchus ocellatus TaxID=259542 RepID=A0AAV4AD28_9GAST|nr:hypothetical protein PoB_003205900 [Plakobranchus ocellatus]